VDQTNTRAEKFIRDGVADYVRRKGQEGYPPDWIEAAILKMTQKGADENRLDPWQQEQLLAMTRKAMETSIAKEFIPLYPICPDYGESFDWEDQPQGGNPSETLCPECHPSATT
jgi:hypothetical protein